MQKLLSNNKKGSIIDLKLKTHLHKLFRCDYEDLSPETVLTYFPLFGISSAFRKFQSLEPLLKHEESAVIRFANQFTTCTLNKSKLQSMTEDALQDKCDELLDIIKKVIEDRSSV